MTPSSTELADLANPAAISVDLDDSWAYLRTQGHPNWANAPTVLPQATERLLQLFDKLGIHVTVFLVGRDLENAIGQQSAVAFREAGHEPANHSLLHRFDLAKLPRPAIAADLDASEAAFEAVLGHKPRGFRCPSFGVSPDLISELAARGYAYDSSLLPTFIGPVLRFYHLRSMDPGARKGFRSGHLFGRARDAFLPQKPFRWSGTNLLEFPITTLPIGRIPIHMSYLQGISSRSPNLAESYFRAALRQAGRRGVGLSFLIHPPDVLNEDDAPDLSYLPGMSRPWRAKLNQVHTTLERILEAGPTATHAEITSSLNKQELPELTPNA